MQFRSLFSFALAAAMGVSVPVVAQPADQTADRESSDTAMQNPAVRLFQQWLHEMATADDATLIQFMKDHVAGAPGGQ